MASITWPPEPDRTRMQCSDKWVVAGCYSYSRWRFTCVSSMFFHPAGAGSQLLVMSFLFNCWVICDFTWRTSRGSEKCEGVPLLLEYMFLFYKLCFLIASIDCVLPVCNLMLSISRYTTSVILTFGFLHVILRSNKWGIFVFVVTLILLLCVCVSLSSSPLHIYLPRPSFSHPI